jgi:PAS domain S-box-containing protein
MNEMKSDFTTLLNTLPGMLYRCAHDNQHTLLFASIGCQALTGYAPGDVVGNGRFQYASLIHPDDKLNLFQQIADAVAKKENYQCVYRLITASGDERWVLDRGEAVLASDGTVQMLEGFVADHSERMTAIYTLEQRVADRTRKLSALYDILEVASDPSDLQTTITRSLRRVLKAIKATVGAIHLLDTTGEALRLSAHQGLPETATARLLQIRMNETQLGGWVARNNEPLFIPQLSEDARFSDLAFSNALNVCIAVPIVANNLVRGVLTVWGDDLSRYTVQEEIELLVSVGEQLGVVVENTRLRQQAEQLMVIEERNRLARELHDSVTQSLYSVTLFAEAGKNLTQSGEYDRAGLLFDDVLETGQQALKEMRLLVHKLRPSILEKEGLVRALQHRLNAVEGRAGVRNHLVIEGSLDLNSDVENELFLVAQEALNNSIKHASASEVRVYLRQDEDSNISLIVVDNGIGFDLELAEEGSGLGLTSMRERIESLGGTISYHSSVGQGTEVRVHLPQESLGVFDE